MLTDKGMDKLGLLSMAIILSSQSVCLLQSIDRVSAKRKVSRIEKEKVVVVIASVRLVKLPAAKVVLLLLISTDCSSLPATLRKWMFGFVLFGQTTNHDCFDQLRREKSRARARDA